MGTTTHYSLRYPELTDTPDGPAQLKNLADDTDAAVFGLVTGPTTYTPTVAGGGSATFTTRTGWYYTIGKMTFFTAYVAVNVAGSGSTVVQVDAPSSIDRTTRQAVGFAGETLKSGSIYVTGHAIAFTSGSGATFDRIRAQSGTSTDEATNLIGSDLKAGGILTIEGWYRAA